MNAKDQPKFENVQSEAGTSIDACSGKVSDCALKRDIRSKIMSEGNVNTGDNNIRNCRSTHVTENIRNRISANRDRRMINGNHGGIRKLKLIAYDLLMLLLSGLVFMVISPSIVPMAPYEIALQFVLASICIILSRDVCRVYAQVWRYSRTNSYIRLMGADAIGGIIYILLSEVLPFRHPTFLRMVNIVLADLVGAIALRYAYTWVYEASMTNNYLRKIFRRNNWWTNAISNAVEFLTGISLRQKASELTIQDENKIRIAIVGAGRTGAMLAEDLLSNPNSVYRPVCFIDIDREKIGRRVSDIPVLPESEETRNKLVEMGVQEMVFALTNADSENKKRLYERYKATGCKMKVYDYPISQTAVNGKRQMREFDIEELLFRQPQKFVDECTRTYYKGKTVLISGGGGSIGSELCRQIAKMRPKKLIILDVYENGAYDIQQELRIGYGDRLDLAVEIISVCDREALDKVFGRYRPNVVLHAAAHKHVPLMEHNCCEAVRNNVFGTLNIVDISEKHGVEKFIMISTDKAVNPTNVMGATKRMCEMIVQSRIHSKTSFSCTRFGNVLGSNGSVIPLFKRQIMNGGPVTLTDKRIIRYFMTIPEASQLVLQSGAMAKNGELYVLDMGNPIKILELAENMIRLSGFEPYRDIDIVETGLRPGEKLYEELLIKTEELDRTSNDKIFVERDGPLSREEIEKKLAILRDALATEDDDVIRRAMKQVVSTYHSPKHVNDAAISSGRYAEEAEGYGSRAVV